MCFQQKCLKAYFYVFPALILCLSSLSLGCSDSTTLPPGPNVGSACEDSSFCTGGLSCIEDARFTGGYCSRNCSDGECPEGSICVEDYGIPLCLQGCGNSGDCRSGYQCWRGTCRPSCSSDTECGAEATCADGLCTGVECLGDDDCGPGTECGPSGECISTADASIPDARPGMGCASGCPDGQVCLPDSLGGRCTPTCTDRDSCADSNLVCSPVELDDDGDGMADSVRPACVDSNFDGRFLASWCVDGSDCESQACVRRTCTEICDDNTDCLPGMECLEVSYPGVDDAVYRGCWYANAATRVAVEEVDLGEHTLASRSSSSRFIFAAPSNATSVTLVAEQLSPGGYTSFAFDDVYSPEERTLFDLDEMFVYRDQIIRWLPSNNDGAAAMLIPNTTPDRYRFRYGRHSFRVVAFREDGADTRARIYARIRRSTSGAPPERLLDLNIHTVGIGVSAAQAPGNTRLQAALGELQRIYARIGITIDDINYFDVPSSVVGRLSVIDSASGPDSELSELFQLSAPRSENAINLFLVREITTSTDGMTLGIAGGIPGPPGVHGSPHSGVAVSFDRGAVGADPDRVAQIMAHEMGHFMGLFHVRERRRPCEPGEVPSATVDCAPFGGEDVLSDTTRDSGDNLMWPTIGGADGRTYNVNLSEGQGSVLFNCSLAH